jgi:phage terminase large subunit-like protein
MRYTAQDVIDLKRHVGTREYRSLYQGDTSFDQGGIFHKDWFMVWKKPFLPKFQFIIQGWDTAMSTTAHACHSASVTFGVFEDEFKRKNIMLLNLWYGKLEFTELFEMIRRQSTNYNCTDLESELVYNNTPDVVVIETKANGKPLLDLLKKAGCSNIIGYNPPPTASRENDNQDSGKVIRARMQSGIVESGRVYLRARPESYTSLFASSQSFLNAACNFPNDIEASRDIIDVFTMILSTLRTKGILRTDLEMAKKGSVLKHMLPDIHVMPQDKFSNHPRYLRSI